MSEIFITIFIDLMEDIFTVVIIDDDRTVRHFASHFLKKKLNVNVLEAADGVEGLRIIMSSRPDLVMVDYLMPDMDGAQVVAAIRNTEGIENTPVIVLTSMDDSNTVIQLASLKILDYMLKPLDMFHSAARIRKIITDNQHLFKKKLPPVNT